MEKHATPILVLNITVAYLSDEQFRELWTDTQQSFLLIFINRVGWDFDYGTSHPVATP